jgi:phosphoglycerate dehydrogenase-like enzyme
MNKFVRIAYTDPWWAVDLATSRVDSTRADLERQAYGPRSRIDLGIFRDGSFLTEGAEFAQYLMGADAIVAYRGRIDRQLLNAMGPGCQVIARQGVGIDSLEIDAIRDYGAYAFNVPDYCVDETSTHALALLLSLNGDVCRQDSLVRSDQWATRSGRIPLRLARSKLGIVGFGTIGRAFASKATGLFEQTLAYDPYVDADLMAGYGVTAVDDLRSLFRRANVISLHASLTRSSRRFIDEDVLKYATATTLLVNTARGGLVDNKALLAALRERRIGGYATDVYDPEPPIRELETTQLSRDPGVISTCHRGFLSSFSDRSVRLRVAEQVVRVLNAGSAPSYGRLA